EAGAAADVDDAVARVRVQQAVGAFAQPYGGGAGVERVQDLDEALGGVRFRGFFGHVGHAEGSSWLEVKRSGGLRPDQAQERLDAGDDLLVVGEAVDRVLELPAHGVDGRVGPPPPLAYVGLQGVVTLGQRGEPVLEL